MLLYMIIQISTMMISIKIKYDTYRNLYKKIGDSGYKINSDKLNMLLKEKNNNRNKIKDTIDVILFVIPGINIVSTTAKRLIETKKFGNELIDNNILIPMSEYEKLAYDNLDTTNKKLSFVIWCDELTKEYDKIKIYFEEDTDLLKRNIAQLYYEKLPQIAYTLEEVKELSDSINLDYKLGKIDGIKSAIIGLPDNSDIKEVIVRKEKSIEKHTYEKISEEEIEKSKFIVYPFGFDFEENEKLKNCYKNILNKRDNNRKNMYVNINNSIIQNDIKTYVKKRVK